MPLLAAYAVWMCGNRRRAGVYMTEMEREMILWGEHVTEKDALAELIEAPMTDVNQLTIGDGVSLFSAVCDDVSLMPNAVIDQQPWLSLLRRPHLDHGDVPFDRHLQDIIEQDDVMQPIIANPTLTVGSSGLRYNYYLRGIFSGAWRTLCSAR